MNEELRDKILWTIVSAAVTALVFAVVDDYLEGSGLHDTFKEKAPDHTGTKAGDDPEEDEVIEGGYTAEDMEQDRPDL